MWEDHKMEHEQFNPQRVVDEMIKTTITYAEGGTIPLGELVATASQHAYDKYPKDLNGPAEAIELYIKRIHRNVLNATKISKQDLARVISARYWEAEPEEHQHLENELMKLDKRALTLLAM